MQPWYVTGFVDGEGSFLVSFSVRSKLRIGIEVRPSFTVSQHARSKRALVALQDFFACGTIRQNTKDQTYKYEVRRLKDLLQKVIPHFERYPLATSKKNDFDIFRELCNSMKQLEHQSYSGLKTIIAMAYRMNNLGARRYTHEALLRILKR